MLLGLGVWPIGKKHRTIELRPNRNSTKRPRNFLLPRFSTPDKTVPHLVVDSHGIPLAVLVSATHGLRYIRGMTIKRLDHVSVVVDYLAAAIAFFTTLGMTIEGEMPIEGPWVDRVNGLESVQVDIVMMRTTDGHGRLELTKFRNPKLVEIEPAIAPP